MTYCTLRSSLTTQPPLTIPEIALRLGVHPAYYQNGIKVLAFNRLPTDKEICPEGLSEGMDTVAASWKSQNATLARVDPVNPPPIKEDGKHVWRFDGGPHADEAVFLPGQGLPQWEVNVRNIGLKQIAIVPPGGALRLPGTDELDSQAEDTDEHGSSGIALVASATVFSVIALTSEEPATGHETGQEAAAHHEFSQEPAAYHEPGNDSAEHYSHMGMDESNNAYQNAQDYLHNEQTEAQPAEELLASEAQADGTILGNLQHG
jgi:hypothetical protein